MALTPIRDIDVIRKQVSPRIDAPPLTGPNTTFWPVMIGAEIIGKVTSAVHSTRLKHNFVLTVVSIDYTKIGVRCDIRTATGVVQATVVLTISLITHR